MVVVDSVAGAMAAANRNQELSRSAQSAPLLYVPTHPDVDAHFLCMREK